MWHLTPRFYCIISFTLPDENVWKGEEMGTFGSSLSQNNRGWLVLLARKYLLDLLGFRSNRCNKTDTLREEFSIR